MDTVLSSKTDRKPIKRYRRYERYHVRLGERRTTVSLDTLLSNLLSLRLGVEPETPEAHRTVCHWLQARLKENGDANRVLVSEWLTHQVIFFLIPDELNRKYGDWLLSQP
jgi:hypothetical protein